MRVTVLDDYHRVFESDPAIQRLRRRVAEDVYSEKLPLERLRAYPILIALRERTRFDAAFWDWGGSGAKRRPSLKRFG